MTRNVTESTPDPAVYVMQLVLAPDVITQPVPLTTIHWYDTALIADTHSVLPVDSQNGLELGAVSVQLAGTFTTEMVALQVDVLPQSSVAVQVRVTS